MPNFISNIKDRFYYSLESIKNRYPCKIIKIKNVGSLRETPSVTYRAVTKYNIRECSAKDIIDDPLLLEKFHPTDCIKLSFLAAGEILLKKTNSLDEAMDLYKKIISEMFKDLQW